MLVIGYDRAISRDIAYSKNVIGTSYLVGLVVNQPDYLNYGPSEASELSTAAHSDNKNYRIPPFQPTCC